MEAQCLGRPVSRHPNLPIVRTRETWWALVSQAAGLSRLWAVSQTRLGKVLVMRVFVAGGTGVVGRRLVPQLVEAEGL